MKQRHIKEKTETEKELTTKEDTEISTEKEAWKTY
jgi:hypothetical protein